MTALLCIVLAAALASLQGRAGADDAKPLAASDMIAAANLHIASLTVVEAKAELDQKVLFLDVREPEEFKDGHIPGALTIPRGVLEMRVAKAIPEKSTKIVVYCRSGARGALATETLGKMGYTAVKNMTGGLESWTDAGYPVE